MNNKYQSGDEVEFTYSGTVVTPGTIVRVWKFLWMTWYQIKYSLNAGIKEWLCWVPEKQVFNKIK